MNAQKGQLNDLSRLGIIPANYSQKINIIVEAGNDNGKTFLGVFSCKINGVIYRIDNGKRVK